MWRNLLWIGGVWLVALVFARASAAPPMFGLESAVETHLVLEEHPSGIEKLVVERRLRPNLTINPLANRPRADACGFSDGLRRLPALDLPYNPLSTARRQPGILMHVHLVLPLESEASTTSASSVRTG
jgi:hypothetical protein